MKLNKLFLFLVLTTMSVWFTSCLNGDNSATYTNAYGYVGTTTSGVTYINTNTQYPYAITWNGISSQLTAGQCVRISYTTDYTTSGNFYLAQNTSVESTMTPYSLNTASPIAVNDSNVVSSLSVEMSSSTTYFGNNWFLSYTMPKAYTTAVPQFYYSSSVADNFNVSKDSVIIDMRLKVTPPTISTTTSAYHCAVDLTPIRNLFSNSSNYAGKTIPVYFRYYTSKTTKATTSLTTIYIPNEN